VIEGAEPQTNSVRALPPSESTAELLFVKEKDWFTDPDNRLKLRAEYSQNETLHVVDFTPTVLPFTQEIGN
jgi:hypothetical protein